MNNLHAKLTDKAEMIKLLENIMRSRLYKKLPEPLNEIYCILAYQYVPSNIDMIFACATTNLEVLFYNSLLITALKESMFFIEIHKPLYDANIKVPKIREQYENNTQLWKTFLQATASHSLLGFIKYVNESDESYEVKYLFTQRTYMLIYDFFHTFSFSPKSNILINKTKIETDLFVWTISNPNIMILIECDEISKLNKESFAQDRERDRLVQSKGLQVFRFSEDEIYNDPLGVAQEIIRYLGELKAW